jgi:DNA invertase Pin-like site-specific DNA recombinase
MLRRLRRRLGTTSSPMMTCLNVTEREPSDPDVLALIFLKTRAKGRPGPETNEEREARTTLKNQVDALTRAGCEKIYKDIASGGTYDRPELNKAIDGLQPGDVLLFYRTDRLSRSLGDLMRLWTRIGDKGAKFKSLTEGELDATSPMGDAMMKIIGVFAELERKMIIDRTHAGLRRAAREGKFGGRKFLLTKEVEQLIVDEVRGGKQQSQVAAERRISPSTVSRIVSEADGKLARRAEREAKQAARRLA